MNRKVASATVLVGLVAGGALACSDAVTNAEPTNDAAPSDPDGGAGEDAETGSVPGTPLSVMTLNMHGYHPMGEAPRFFQDHANAITAAASSPFYFTRAELERGNRARLDALAADLKKRLPDILALQEVGAGSPDSARDCAAFEKTVVADAPEANTGLRLAARLASDGYSAVVGCRGNVGWVTDPNTFSQSRVVKMNGATPEVVYDFGANPYPQGILVEGFAVLYRAPLAVIDHDVIDVVFNKKGESIKSLFVALALDGAKKDDPNTPWVAVVDVHGGHKVAHFEQAVAIRKWLSTYLASSPRRTSLGGVVLLGDFNARLHRPTKPVVLDEPSTVPWEIDVPNQYSYRHPSDSAAFTKLRDELRSLNASQYKPYATLPAPEAETRIDDALASFSAWMNAANEDSQNPVVLTEALSAAGAKKLCTPPSTGFAACSVDARIDHVFFGGALALAESHALYTNYDDHDLEGTLSDHPSVFTSFTVPR